MIVRDCLGKKIGTHTAKPRRGSNRQIGEQVMNARPIVRRGTGLLELSMLLLIKLADYKMTHHVTRLRACVAHTLIYLFQNDTRRKEVSMVFRYFRKSR